MKIILLAAALLFVSALSAQTTLPLPSSWEGEIPSQKKTVLAFQFFMEGDTLLKAVMHSPGEGVFGITCKNIIRNADSVLADVPSIKGKLAVKYDEAANQLTGRWQQGGAVVPITLKPVPLHLLYGKEKIQTPKPPFDYASEDVLYANADSSVRLGATITWPKTKGLHPAVILITGSGQQDRDETLMGHKPFAIISDYLTKMGFVVMRVDDRGVGKSKGDLKYATTADFAKDVELSLDFLLKRKEVDVKRVGLIGHSEGGMIAPMVAVKRKEIGFIVLLAGPGGSIIELMGDQNAAILNKSGYAPEAVASYRGFYMRLCNAITKAPNDSAAMEAGVAAFKNWQAAENPAIVTSLTAVPENNTPEKFVKLFVTQLRGAWWRYFLQYDAQPNLKKLSCKVLAVNGGEDIQVLPSSLTQIEKALAQSKSKKYETQLLPGLNHLFQRCHYCVTGEYAQLKESFSTEALEVMGNWLQNEVFGRK
jgi:uncharacterized protein